MRCLFGRAAPPRAQAIGIPAKTRPSRCKLCGRTIYWVIRPSTQRRVPVSIAAGPYQLADARAPGNSTAGAGIDEHIDCPALRRPRPKLAEQEELAL